ncbi:hypothetical protein B0H13DRAFT_2261804 [Mycena leptocephala]|nr:hypothetical protein B0H13DRAFT_2261804 [Mycena leptocephala]
MILAAHTDASGSNGSLKRSQPFAGFDDPTEAKRQKTYDEPSHVDVFLWNVNIDAGSPISIARKAMDELKMKDLTSNIISVVHPRTTPRTPKTVISIRFRCIAIAEEFIDRLRSNPPQSMAKLQAAKQEVYEKKQKAKGSSEKSDLPCLRITAWNIHGRLAVKITQPDIVRLINDNDVIIFQETFLRIGEERTLQLPAGFEIIAMSRPDLPGFRCAGGGVAAVIRLTVPYKLMTHLCAPDLIVLDLHHLSLIGAYVLPKGSNWREWTDVDPEIRMAEAVTVLSALPDKPLMFKGDTNSRTGDRAPTAALLARTSADPVVNSRGRRLLRLCLDTAMTILNGLVPRIKDSDLRVVKSGYL